MKARRFNERWPAAAALAAVLLMHGALAVLLRHAANGSAGEGGWQAAPAEQSSIVLMLWTEPAPTGPVSPGQVAPPATANAKAAEPAATLPFAGTLPPRGDKAGNEAAMAPDRPALALTAPDLRELALWPTSGAPIRLRLHIDASGHVGAVELLECAQADQVFAQALIRVLQATPHVPARRAGEDVASVKEVELQFAPPVEPAAAPSRNAASS